MSTLTCEFFGTEDGEPWCAFVWGQHPIGIVDTAYIREKIQREMDVWDLGEETSAEIAEHMKPEPMHLWLKQVGTIDDAPTYQFCAEGDEGALAITGWKLR